MHLSTNPPAGAPDEDTRRSTRVALVLEKLLGGAVETLAALLITAEICILLAGVIARYFLNTPLVWTDEAASLLFLWLASLGAVVALRRGEHMRMTALVAKASPGRRAWLDTVAIAATLAFLLMIVWPALEFAIDEAIVTSPSLEISNAWRAAALPTGLALMAVMAAIRLLRVGDWRQVASALGTVALVSIAFYALGPVFKGLGNANLLIFFVGLTAATVLIGVPIAVAFGLATFGFLALTTSLPITVMSGAWTKACRTSSCWRCRCSSSSAC